MRGAVGPFLLAISLAMGPSGCGKEFEGDEPGECEDGADNDRDGRFDCRDEDCAGALICDGVDTQPPDDSDTPIDVTPDDTDIDFSDGRPPGPWAREYNLVSAWQQFPETVTSQYNPACTAVGDADWVDVFDPPTYSGTYVYVFYRVADSGTAAKGQRCPNGFPLSCVDSSVVYTIDDHIVTGALDPINVQIDPLTAPGCTVTLNITAIVADEGETGVLDLDTTLSTTASCPAEIALNNGCNFTHTYDLQWVRAE